MTAGTIGARAIKSAVLSPCGLYRYELRRVWNPTLPPLVACMLNPSTADAEVDDPTIRRLYGFAEREGCGGVFVCNVGAGRSSSPRTWAAMRDPVGPENWVHVNRLMKEARFLDGIFLCAWGQNAPDRLVARVFHMANTNHLAMSCLGRTKSGAPRHPLYVPADYPLEPYP